MSCDKDGQANNTRNKRIKCERTTNKLIKREVIHFRMQITHSSSMPDRCTCTMRPNDQHSNPTERSTSTISSGRCLPGDATSDSWPDCPLCFGYRIMRHVIRRSLSRPGVCCITYNFGFILAVQQKCGNFCHDNALPEFRYKIVDLCFWIWNMLGML